jgi:hypothetical protein
LKKREPKVESEYQGLLPVHIIKHDGVPVGVTVMFIQPDPQPETEYKVTA